MGVPLLVQRLLVPLGSRRVGGDVGTVGRLPAQGRQPFQSGDFDGGFGEGMVIFVGFGLDSHRPQRGR